MKVSLNWLTDYVDVSMPATELGELLTQIGINCEQIIETETDVVLDLEVTSNRPDLLGHLGVARELAAATGAAFNPPDIAEPPASGEVADLAEVEVLEPALCPRYTARVIRGVKVGPAPASLAERLEAVGIRSVNNIVDATNYVLMEYAQPLHGFDYDKLAGHKIVVRRAMQGEVLLSIDQSHCKLDENMLVIADAEKCIAIAGVMGGLDTELTDGTTNVLIESARFDPLCTRRTSRRLGLMTESNYRFERGVDPAAVDRASLRACAMIVELAGGELAAGVLDVWAEPFDPRRVALRPERTDALLGMDTPEKRQFEILRRLGLSPKRDGGRIVCAVPAYRADLSREVDLVEEIARIEGYDRIPVAEKVSHEVAGEGLAQRVRREAASLLAAAGFDETVTFAFLDAEETALFGQAEPVCVDASSRKTDNALRTTLLASLLRACKANQDAGNGEVSLFELAGVFSPQPGEAMPAEHTAVAMVTTGNLRDVRGAIEELAARIAPGSKLDVRPSAAAGLADGTTAELFLDDERFGVLGVVAKGVLDYYGLERGVAAAEVGFECLLARAGKRRTYKPVPKFPPVRRDLSLIVDDGLTWRKLVDAVDSVAQPMRTAVDYVTTFRGKPIPHGRKSVTISLTYRSPDGTLRSEQVDEQVRAIVTAVRKKFNAELRA
ncbi:MAG: phenylalanine--tRNA ligase subunit beta [Planctomycetota bacterium]|nr:phenylalanine--tRNA ligase subunit beta [Planctomycetota bacterium]